MKSIRKIQKEKNRKEEKKKITANFSNKIIISILFFILMN